MKSLILLTATLVAAQGTADLIWERTYPIPELSLAPYMTLAARDGGVYVVTTSSHHNSQVDWNEVELTRYDEDGTQLWQRTNIMSAPDGVLLAEDPFGNVFLGTQTQSLFSGPTDPKLYKFSPTGGELWSEFPAERWNESIKVNQNGSFYWVHGNRTQLRDSFGTALWGLDGGGKLHELGPWQALQDRGSTIRILGAAGVIRTFPTMVTLPNAVGHMISPDRYVRGDTHMARCYDTFGNVLWTTTLDAWPLAILSDTRHVFVVTVTSVFWLDHQGNLLRQTPNTFHPYAMFMDGIGGGFLAINIRERHTRHFGRVSSEPDTAGGNTAGTKSDLYTATYSPGLITLRRYHNGIDHLSATLTRGTNVENSHFAVMHSGDGYWSMGPGVTFSSAQAPISILFKYLTPPEPPTEMGMIVESRASASAIRQQVEAYNFATATWVTLESNVQMPAGAQPDRYAVIDIPNPTAFVDPSTKEVHIRAEYRAVGPVFVYPWQVRLDRTMLRYVK